MQPIHIDADRLWQNLHTIGAHGAEPDGISRLAWEAPYKKAAEQLMRQMEEHGMSVRIDTVGNIFARLEGSDPSAPCVLSGSHFDTVPKGGLFDGLAGVMAAFESIISIRQSGLTHRRPIEMVAFINEEASQFLGGTFGSKALCGTLPADYAYTLKHRQTGQPLAKAMREYGMGLDPDNLQGSAINPKNYYAFLELHIEQGCYLLDKALPMAVVSSIAGIKQFYITVRGVAAHTGGMSMKDRRDAMAAAATIACKVEQLALNTGNDSRGTVGYIETSPAEHNIIAERCIIPVDFRESDDIIWEKLYTDLLAFTENECQKRNLSFSVHSTLNNQPAHCHPVIINTMNAAASSLHIPHTQMISYPAHDAMNMSRIMPMGMIFLRSQNKGASHCPQEFTSKEDLAAGTAVLAQTIFELSNTDLL